MDNGKVLAHVSNNTTGWCRASKRSSNEIRAAVSEIPLSERTSFERLPAASNILETNNKHKERYKNCETMKYRETSSHR